MVANGVINILRDQISEHEIVTVNLIRYSRDLREPDTPVTTAIRARPRPPPMNLAVTPDLEAVMSRPTNRRAPRVASGGQVARGLEHRHACSPSRHLRALPTSSSPSASALRFVLRVLIVDDEPLARRRLARLVSRQDEAERDLELIGEAGDGDSAATIIRALAPDVVLLDIRMPGVDGVALARQLAAAPSLVPVVIFTTAHPEHAVDAFDAGAVDYLLKPIDPALLDRAFARARERLAARRALGARAPHSPAPAPAPATATATTTSSTSLSSSTSSPPSPQLPGASPLARELLAPPPAPPRLTARCGATVRLFDPRLISRFWAEDKYTVFRHGGAEHLLDESLLSLAQRLAPWGFLRVHRKELVQLARIRALHAEGETAELELDDDQRAPVSRRCLPILRRHLAGDVDR